MADVPAQGPFRLVYLVFNTLFNLPSAGRQADCFRDGARALDAHGAFVLECFVPDLARYDRGQRVEALAATEDSATIGVVRHDAGAQRLAASRCTAHHVRAVTPATKAMHRVPARR